MWPWISKAKSAPAILLWFAEKWFLAAAALVFFSAAFEYVQKPPMRTLDVVAAAVLILWTMAYRFGAMPIAPDFGFVAVFFAAAWVLVGLRPPPMKMASIACWPLRSSSWAWCPPPNCTPPARPAKPCAALGVLLSAPQLLSAALMLLAAYERQNARVERNVLALSNLNLAASGLQSGEAETGADAGPRARAGRGRLPRGRGPAAPGQRARQEIDGHHRRQPNPSATPSKKTPCATISSSSPARLGGLAVFRDLGRDAAWSALEREEMFSRFRRLAVSQDLQTVVGIGLQSKEEVPGVLLLAAPDSRDLNASEFRLLAALGQQMGVAVDNSSLMQNAWRRSEELHVLNEIGQALSSTLEPDALLEKIYAEMQRLFAMADFYIAISDDARQTLRFELEVVGRRAPAQAQPPGRQSPLRVHHAHAAARLDLREFHGRDQKHGRRAGPANSPPTAACLWWFTTASSASWLCRGGRSRCSTKATSKSCACSPTRRPSPWKTPACCAKSRPARGHLTLLNNISRHAIAMLPPDEMLSRIAEQLERGLTFDHMGIGLLDHASKEVVIRAEAGRRRGAVGRRLKLGGSLVGRVASIGQMSVVKEAAGDTDMHLVLDDSASGVAVPLLFADQIHGVLYVETEEARDLSEEEIQLLHTLADLISGALHHSLTLQKAREQAVTDGLTGVKTHRYLMEALSAEWKRSTRASRPFCLLLADLDRFKFVNDFFGHLEGDLVLKRVGRILEQNCRSSDVVARYGGDEFVILMPESDIEQSRQLAEKLRACISSDSFLRAKNVTASLGIASFPADGSTPQELIQIADASMYLSKHQGGNAVSTAGHLDPDEARQWKRDVLEAYLGVTLKRLFSTGPEAFAEIHRRLEQFSHSLPAVESAAGRGRPVRAPRPPCPRR